ncbi:LexA family protein [Paenibacillus naphthalenovorans]|uniref:LexA family protein n=1 Tax=Paenibacillus naphthalenovorans TaxID=162209 RepID=UPI000884D125|nr:S24 family peptidase [Paenibacillus naphthalenovorans]SDJ09183.1 repressor LexA [Paenibacillus naphthalenovorans]
MRSSKEVINIIKNLRERKGLSVEELARRIGIAKSTLSRYENGQREFPINDLGQYAKTLDTTVEYLLGIEKNNQNSLIPLIGTICAGNGLLAEQNIEDYIHYPFQQKRQPDYALRVKGDSMIGAGIDDGDIVYMRNAQWAEYNGQIVAAIINDAQDGTLKRIKWSEGSPYIRLIPENEEYAEIEVLPREVMICGIYMGHFKPEKEI